MADTKKIRPIRPRGSIAYFLDNKIRSLAIKALALFKSRVKEERHDLLRERIEKILLVRASFRMGSSILVTPAIFLFRSVFPHARIDFVGSPISRALFQNLPIDHHFSITRRFPDASWAYLLLLKQIRSMGYDLAVDVSCTQSAMGSFIVGFSGARFRVGTQGRWDLWFNVRIPRPAAINKYRVLPEFLGLMGLQTQEIFPVLILSPAEKEDRRKKIEAMTGGSRGPIVGVFVGGREAKGKGWSMDNFCRLVTALYDRGISVVVFFGPEEEKRMGFFRQAVGKDIPLVFEPSARDFAAMISNCSLFIACDSGPMHLACALGVRTIAIFESRDMERWRPPANVAQIVSRPGGVPAKEVLKICLTELSCSFVPRGSLASS